LREVDILFQIVENGTSIIWDRKRVFQYNAKELSSNEVDRILQETKEDTVVQDQLKSQLHLGGIRWREGG
jgi:hypothetical protein